MKNEFDYLNSVKVDFSDYDLKDLTDMERKNMKNIIVKDRNKLWKSAASIAACLTVVIMLNQSVFAQSIVSNILKSISTGYNNFIQVDSANSISMDVEDDNSIEVKISDKQKDDPIATGSDDTRLIIKDEKEIYGYLNFKAKLPAYLPDGYTFYGAELFKNNDGTVSGDYLTAHYIDHSSGKRFIVMERLLNNDTAFTSSTDGTIEETEVNGCKAVLEDGKTLSWETGNISICIAGREALAGNELFETAASIK